MVTPAYHHSYLPPFHPGPGQPGHSGNNTHPWPSYCPYSGTLLYTSINVLIPPYTVPRSAQDVVTSTSVCCGELRPARPRDHCPHIFDHFNHSYPATISTSRTTACSMLQILTADPSLSSWPPPGRSIQCQNCQILCNL